MTLKEELQQLFKDTGLLALGCIPSVAEFIERREEAERERVKSCVHRACGDTSMTFPLQMIETIYPPKVKMLPAGSYIWRRGKLRSGGWLIADEEFEPCPDIEYYPIKNPFEDQTNG